jgi:hypothetical protein
MGCRWNGADDLDSLAGTGLGIELISTNVGTHETGTMTTHLLLGPVGHEPTLHSSGHVRESVTPSEHPRACAYDHAQKLIDTLAALGRTARVELEEASFADLERVE